MLTVIALSAALLQEPPAPPPPRDSASEVLIVRTPGDGEGHHITLRRTGPDGEPRARGGREHDATFIASPAGPDGWREITVRTSHGEPRVIRLQGRDGPHEGPVEIRRLHGPGTPGEMDSDGDGKVSEAEFLAPLREAFARMDADRSGFIETGERDAEGGVHVFSHRVERREGEE